MLFIVKKSVVSKCRLIEDFRFSEVCQEKCYLLKVKYLEHNVQSRCLEASGCMQ